LAPSGRPLDRHGARAAGNEPEAAEERFGYYPSGFRPDEPRGPVPTRNRRPYKSRLAAAHPALINGRRPGVTVAQTGRAPEPDGLLARGSPNSPVRPGHEHPVAASISAAKPQLTARWRMGVRLAIRRNPSGSVSSINFCASRLSWTGTSA
jgi:hypothetical protein